MKQPKRTQQRAERIRNSMDAAEQAQASKDLKRYKQALHGMQSGVATEMELDPDGGAAVKPKHLRVGINSAMVEHGALADLLVRKGIITALEYGAAIADGMEEERERYEILLSERFGKEVKLA